MIILTCDELITKAHQKHKETVATIESFDKIIEVANRLVKEYKGTDYVDFISMAYPQDSNDYLLIIIYLAEKGSIMRDLGTFIDELVSETGLEFIGDVLSDANNQTKRWELIDKTRSYTISCGTEDYLRHPRVAVKVDATKAKTCIRRETGRMIPEYEFVCEEE
jgi:hypothetical protein